MSSTNTDHFNPNLTIHMYRDAVLERIGAVLKQLQEDNEDKPVAYYWKNGLSPEKKKLYTLNALKDR